jgi:hypothetical protein
MAVDVLPNYEARYLMCSIVHDDTYGAPVGCSQTHLCPCDFVVVKTGNERKGGSFR